MEYQISEDKRQYYEYHVDKVIKIQSLIRRRYWLILYIAHVKILIDTLFQRENKKYTHVSTIFGDDSDENIKMLEIAFKQRQKQMKEGELAQLLMGNWYGWEDLGVGHSSGLD